MMLSEALCCHFLGREWRKTKGEPLPSQYYQLLKLFEDNPASPFSVHKIAQIGMKYGKGIGEWFGPSTVAQVLNDLVAIYPIDGLAMCISNDSSLYLDELTKICLKNSSKWRSLFIMVPLRLGLDSFNAVYFSSLKAFFKLPQSIGIVGGKPRAAMYFIGYQDSNLFYLDPHVVQPAVNMSTDQFRTESYHCSVPNKMPMSSVDPSLAIGFYCSDQNDFNDFWRRAKELSKMENPILGIEECAPDYRQDKKETLSVEGFEDDIVIL